MTKRRFILANLIKEIFCKVFSDDVPNNNLYDSMDDAIECWLSLYYNEPNWLEETHGNTLNLSASIASEFARLIMIEFDVEITGSQRADYLQKRFAKVASSLRINLEEACSVGGIVFKPYVSNRVLLTDCVTQDKFIPIEFNDDEITGAVFITQHNKGKDYYFRLEKQVYSYETHSHTVTNKFFMSKSPDKLGIEISANRYPFKVVQDFTINNVDRPLFSFWRVPLANTIEKDNPLGVSVYSRAVKLIKEADKQWDRFLWEYEGGELAVDASDQVLRRKIVTDSNGKEIKIEMPKTQDRLFRRLNLRKKDDETFYNVFAPQLRDSSYGSGLDRILRKIEFACALAYGTISDPQNVDKTAEEVKNSKQRSFAVVDNMQQALQTTLENYIYALDRYTEACNLAPKGDYEIKWNWGDGVLEDREKEQAIRLQEVNSQIINKIEYLKWRYGVKNGQALKMLPKQSGVKDFFDNEDGE